MDKPALLRALSWLLLALLAISGAITGIALFVATVRWLLQAI